MQIYVGEEVQLHEFLTSASDGGKCSAPCPGLFTPQVESLQDPLYGRKEGPRA